MHDKDFDWGLPGVDLDDEDDDDYDDFDVHEKGFVWVLSTSGDGEEPHCGQRIQFAFFFFSLSPLSMMRRKLLNSLKKRQCVTMTQGYDHNGAGLMLRILIIEMIFIGDIFFS